MDTRAAAGMIEEDDLLERRRIELAVVTQEQRRLREAVRLPGRVEAEDIPSYSFVLTMVFSSGVNRNRPRSTQSIAPWRPRAS
jgi:hypothetical protein